MGQAAPLRQLFYESVATNSIDLDAILQQSRHNNAVDGVTGLLWFDGERFLQVLEGPPNSVEAAFNRIARDERHRDIRTLADRTVPDRDFGYWSMERGDAADAGMRARLDRRLAGASPTIRARFIDCTGSDGLADRS